MSTKRIEFATGYETDLASTDTAPASAVVVTPSGNLSSTDVQAALVELQMDVDARAPQSTTYTKAETDTALALKANQATTYTKTEVDDAIAALVDSSPATLDTLNELAAALGEDPNFATTVATQIGEKADSTDPVLNGTVTGTAVMSIAMGGTGQSAKTAAFDALAPTTTKGDIIASDGSDNVRLAAGSNGQVLTADSAEVTGLKWTSGLTNPMSTAGDMIIGGASGAATRLDTSLLGNYAASYSSTTFTDAAVTAGTGVFTITSHGLNTGDTVYFTNSGGALPVGLSASTKYFVVKTGANTFKLAEFSAKKAYDVESGITTGLTFVSAAGGGTHTIHKGGVISRNRQVSTFAKGLTATVNATYTTAFSMPISPGTWLIDASILFKRNSATFSGSVIGYLLLSNTLNSSTGSVEGLTMVGRNADGIPTSFVYFQVNMPKIYLRYDGTTATLIDGSTMTLTSNFLYLNYYLENSTAGSPRYAAQLTCQKISDEYA